MGVPSSISRRLIPTAYDSSVYAAHCLALGYRLIDSDGNFEDGDGRFSPSKTNPLTYLIK